MKYTDIFVPGGFPTHTYNPREENKLEEKIEEGRNNLCKLVTITGQTKTGKTVLTKKTYPKEDSIWIDGGSIKSEDDFWNSLIDQLEYYQTETVTNSEEKSGGSIIEDSLKGEFVILSGTKKYSVSEVGKNIISSTKTKKISTKISALRGLTQLKIPLVIDDFHYINRAIQGDLIRALKSPIFEGLPVIIIAIPHKRYDAVKVEKEMTGRISIIPIPIWSLDELKYIAETGFTKLNFDVSDSTISLLADEAIGSPHLMQEFCRNISKLMINGKIIDSQLIESMFREIAENIGRPIFEKLMKGPRQRNDRIQRLLKTGENVDIYGLILAALAHMKPGLISIEYEELRQSIREIIASQLPQLHEVARVLKYMSNIAATDESSAPVIDFDENEKKLNIMDPFFAFYLKWGKI